MTEVTPPLQGEAINYHVADAQFIEVTEVTQIEPHAETTGTVLMPIAAPGGGQTWTRIDAEDVERLATRSWWLHPDGYAAADVTSNMARTITYLHREVLAAPPDRLVDHINGDRLDNRAINLRLATHSENNANSVDRPRRSGYRGVYWHGRASKWVAQISVGGSLKHLGLFRESAGGRTRL